MIITKVYISDLGYLMVTVESNGVKCNHVAGSLRDMLPEEIAKLPIETTSGYILNETKHELAL
jgi:hypothetical protein